MEQNERIKTFIEGFDRILEGGIPQGHIVLVSGTPGTMIPPSFTTPFIIRQSSTGRPACMSL
jgi:KaiC/GvpD/RAD55 family RecA-like ATPase